MNKKDFKISKTISFPIKVMTDLETIANEKKISINRLVQDIITIYVAGQNNKKKQKGELPIHLTE